MSDTVAVTSTVDVLSKYKSLVSASLGGDSVYIRAKETIDALVADGSVDEAKKAEILSSIIGGVVSSITSSSMSAALDWAKYEKELALKKLEMDLQLHILVTEGNLKTAQVEQVKTQTRASLAETRRMHGVAVFDATTGALLSLDNTGKVFTDMQAILQQTTNAVSENTLLGSKLVESQVAIHKVIADTYVNYGSYTFTQNANGVSVVTPTHGAFVTLSDTQKDIAVEQGKGYAYNAWANALTGTSSMLGTAIASDLFDFTVGSTGETLLNTVLSCAQGLQKANTTDTDATPETV